MLRWISAVPPQIVSDREKKNADSIGLTGYPSRPRWRITPGHDSSSPVAAEDLRVHPEDVERQLHDLSVVLGPEHLVGRAERGDARGPRCPRASRSAMRQPLTRMIWTVGSSACISR